MYVFRPCDTITTLLLTMICFLVWPNIASVLRSEFPVHSIIVMKLVLHPNLMRSLINIFIMELVKQYVQLQSPRNRVGGRRDIGAGSACCSIDDTVAQMAAEAWGPKSFSKQKFHQS